MSLITYAYFRDFSGIGQNVEDKDLKNAFFRSEEDLKFIIGKTFYDALVSQLDGSDGEYGSLTTENIAFYDPYVKQFLAAQAFSYYTVTSSYSFTRPGIRNFNEDQSTTGTDKLIGEIIKNAKQQAQSFRGRLINFLRGAQKVTSTAYASYVEDCSDKMGSSFHITAISKEDDVYVKIYNQTSNNF